MRKLAIVLALIAGLFPAIAAAQAPPAVPALPDSERRTSYSLSASTCACSVGFALYGSGTDVDQWIQVYVGGTRYLSTDSTHGWGITSATGSLATIARPITNAVLTFTSAQTGTVQIVGSERPRRLAQFNENRGVAARDLNQAITNIIAQNRETWDRSLRSFLAPPGETIGLLPSQASRAGGVLAFDSSGNPIAVTALTGLGNVVGPNTSVVGHIATFGNTLGTLLLDGGLIGAGDFVGPGSSTANHAVTFADTSGKLGKDSGLTLTPSTGTFTLTNAKTLAVTNTLTLGGTDGSTVAFGGGGTVTYTANTLAVFAATTSAQLAGVISDETGTGALVFANTPTLVTPVLGVATATSINKVAITAPATSATLTIADGKTLTANASLTLAGTDSKTLTVSNSLTLAGTDGKTLTTNASLTLAGTDGKTLTVSNSGTLGGGDAFTLAIAAAKTLTVSNTLTFNGTDGTTFTYPTATDTLVGRTSTDTLTNKTLTSPTINGGTATALTSLGIRSTGSGAFDLTLANTENLTAGRTLTLTVNNAARTLSMSGNITTAADFITSGTNSLTLSTTGTTNVTLPVSGTLATRDVANTFSATNTFTALQQFTDVKFSSGKLYPTADSTTALQVTKADGTTRIVNFDTTNARVGINKTAGAYDLDVNGAANVGGRLTFSILDGASLAASPSTITDMTVNNSPSSSNDYVPYYNASAGAWRRATVGSIAAGATAGVSSLNGLTGGLSVVAGNGISVSAASTSVTVNITGYEPFNAQTGTSYTLVDGDRGKVITASNAAAQAYTLPQAGASSTFIAGWFADVANISTNTAGIVTITPTTSTINGKTTLVLPPGSAARIISDGTNYTAEFVTAARGTQIYTSGSNTFTVPNNVFYICWDQWGAGGGGGKSNATNAGSGGGSGAYATGCVVTIPGATFTANVGAGGTGSTGSGGGNGNATVFGSNSCPGGNGGSDSGAGAGAGGTACSGGSPTQDYTIVGQVGGQYPAFATVGLQNHGGDAPRGGSGGVAAISSSCVAGNAPGGGGSGGNTTTTNGCAGGAGAIRIWWHHDEEPPIAANDNDLLRMAM
jgi:hypothetical protein